VVTIQNTKQRPYHEYEFEFVVNSAPDGQQTEEEQRGTFSEYDLNTTSHIKHNRREKKQSFVRLL